MPNWRPKTTGGKKDWVPHFGGILKDIWVPVDIPAVWREYASGEGRLTTCGLDEVGHFYFEEDPEPCYVAITGWLRDVLWLRV